MGNTVGWRKRGSFTKRGDSMAKQKRKAERLSKTALDVDRFLYPEQVTGRPKTRGDCSGVPRPCPYVGCRYNVYLEIGRSGRVLRSFPDLEPWEIPPGKSCALDMAELDGMVLEDVGEAFSITRERARQIEEQALSHLIKTAPPIHVTTPRVRLPVLDQIEEDEHGTRISRVD